MDFCESVEKWNVGGYHIVHFVVLFHFSYITGRVNGIPKKSF